jgi:hypothetical protein
MLDLIRGLGPSIIRTMSPWLVGLIVTGLARIGIDWTPSAEALLFVTGIVATVWYALVRWLETQRDTRWGWLLGLPTPPSYANARTIPGEVLSDEPGEAGDLGHGQANPGTPDTPPL